MSDLITCPKCNDLGWIHYFNPPGTNMMSPIHPDNSDGNKISSKNIIFQACDCSLGKQMIFDKNP
jgi:hypothetical protein